MKEKQQNIKVKSQVFIRKQYLLPTYATLTQPNDEIMALMASDPENAKLQNAENLLFFSTYTYGTFFDN